MRWRGRLSPRSVPSFDRCEARMLPTLVFVFNGNAYDAAEPNTLTADAAQVIEAAGHQAVQLATPRMDSRAALQGLAKEILSRSHGQPIGLVGFSAGGTEAERLAGIAKLNVIDVL